MNKERPQNEPLADVIDIRTARRKRRESLDAAQLSDEQVVALFISQMTHPHTFHLSSSEIGIYVQNHLSRYSPESDTEDKRAWHDRIVIAMGDADSDDEQLEADVPLAALEAALRASLDKAKDVVDERKAMLLLRDLRAGVVVRGETNEATDKKWMALIDHLTSNLKA